MSLFTRCLAAFAVLLLAACKSGDLQPASTWPAATLSTPLHAVQVEKYLPERYSAKGSGIIVHSSKERGTYVLTCGHIACYTSAMPLVSPIAETANQVGKRYACEPGTPVTVRIHARSLKRPDKAWQEWAEFQGEVLYGEFVLKTWPYNSGTYRYTNKESPRPVILDVALVHLRTGFEPFETSETGPDSGFWPDFGTAAGISYTTHRPESESIFAINDGVFFFDGHYSSGFGIYDAQNRLSGLYVSKMELDTGVLKIGNVVYKPTEQYHFVPISTIRSALGGAGYDWVLR